MKMKGTLLLWIDVELAWGRVHRKRIDSKRLKRASMNQSREILDAIMGVLDKYKGVFLSELISSKKLLKEHFNIYSAFYRGHLIAYMIFQEYNGLMALSKAASRTEFLAKHPNDVLIAYVLKEACEKRVRWVEYTFDRVRSDGKIPSLYPGLRAFKRKFGFKDVPIPVYRLGLTRSGRIIQHLYSARERMITSSAYLPKSVRGLFLKFYAPRRQSLSGLLHV